MYRDVVFPYMIFLLHRSQVTNNFGIDWMQRHLGDDYQIHVLDFKVRCSSVTSCPPAVRFHPLEGSVRGVKLPREDALRWRSRHEAHSCKEKADGVLLVDLGARVARTGSESELLENISVIRSSRELGVCWSIGLANHAKVNDRKLLWNDLLLDYLPIDHPQKVGTRAPN